jgi:hypothetical protein
MSYLVLYKFSPEIGLKTYLESNLKESGLIDRKIPINVVLGHPLFVEGFSNETPEKFFPVVGLEHVTDTRIESIGQNYKLIKNTDTLKEQFQNYKTIETTQRIELDYIVDELTQAESIERFIHSVESQVIIAGFTSGNHGRSTLRLLYNAVDGILDGVCHDIMREAQGVKVEVQSNIQMNIESDQFGFPVWGFEIPLKIIQPRMTIRSKSAHTKNIFDVHLKNSRTEFNWSMGIWNLSV